MDVRRSSLLGEHILDGVQETAKDAVHLRSDVVTDAGGPKLRRKHAGGAPADVGGHCMHALLSEAPLDKAATKPHGFQLNRRIVRLGVVAQGGKQSARRGRSPRCRREMAWPSRLWLTPPNRPIRLLGSC